MIELERRSVEKQEIVQSRKMWRAKIDEVAEREADDDVSEAGEHGDEPRMKATTARRKWAAERDSDGDGDEAQVEVPEVGAVVQDGEEAREGIGGAVDAEHAIDQEGVEGIETSRGSTRSAEDCR